MFCFFDKFFVLVTGQAKLVWLVAVHSQVVIIWTPLAGFFPVLRRSDMNIMAGITVNPPLVLMLQARAKQRQLAFQRVIDLNSADIDRMRKGTDCFVFGYPILLVTGISYLSDKIIPVSHIEFP